MNAAQKQEHSKPPRDTGEYGAITAPGTVRLERLLPGPLERVWAYLTESEKRGKWLASGQMELRVGGRVELKFHHADLSAEKTPPDEFKRLEAGHTITGRVLACDPPRLLSYTWGDQPEDSEVTFQLTPRGPDVLLVVTHRRLPSRAMMVSVASGWHSHIAILIDNLNGREPRPFWSTVLQTKAEYENRFPPSTGLMEQSS